MFSSVANLFSRYLTSLGVDVKFLPSIFRFLSEAALGTWLPHQRDRIVSAWKATWLRYHEYFKHNTLCWDSVRTSWSTWSPCRPTRRPLSIRCSSGLYCLLCSLHHRRTGMAPCWVHCWRNRWYIEIICSQVGYGLEQDRPTNDRYRFLLFFLCSTCWNSQYYVGCTRPLLWWSLLPSNVSIAYSFGLVLASSDTLAVNFSPFPDRSETAAW